MDVKSLMKMIKGKYIIEFGNDHYSSELTIPDKIMKSEVVSISMKDDKIIINIDELKNTKSLEDLGYSFEAGV